MGSRESSASASARGLEADKLGKAKSSSRSREYTRSFHSELTILRLCLESNLQSKVGQAP